MRQRHPPARACALRPWRGGLRLRGGPGCEGGGYPTVGHSVPVNLTSCADRDRSLHVLFASTSSRIKDGLPKPCREQLPCKRGAYWQWKKVHREWHLLGPCHSSTLRKPPPPKLVLLQSCQTVLQQQRGKNVSLWPSPCCHQAGARPQMLLLLLHLMWYPVFPVVHHSRTFLCSHKHQSSRIFGLSLSHPLKGPCWQQPCCCHLMGSPWQPFTAQITPATLTGHMQVIGWHSSARPTADSGDSSTVMVS
ncbi:uncharacterized protein LOC110393494 [Numida meleagris]|uniref:uncharacterized protein LOC110393494 n=1 Tax=Numida meleagris TaxID=8996 RepID=UPI000B3DC593|nr:uncharacterized protein LOC110393494 [Numida meleagris]